MNLHDWIDELCDALDIEVELDEAMLLDLSKVIARNVVRPAVPLSMFLLGVAFGGSEDHETIDEYAGRAQLLAEKWDRPAGAPDPDDTDVEVPDDTAVDHTGDRYEA
ncbi:MAG: DUF6457 domain-containing protein [Nocardioides sp.]|uniref:DUF6457 domain-containing protein n=1 Tax=Nocardioides sp. TaxID=35761 RepID=UPI003EFDC0AA